MSGQPCIHCNGVFPTSEHDCGVKYVGTFAQWDAQLDYLGRCLEDATKEVARLNEELMKRDTMPDFERGEFAGQDAMMRHIAGMDETNNSALALCIRNSAPFKARAEVLRQVAETLEYASYKIGETFDPEAAKAFHFELGICQARAERLQGKKEE